MVRPGPVIAVWKEDDKATLQEPLGLAWESTRWGFLDEAGAYTDRAWGIVQNASVVSEPPNGFHHMHFLTQQFYT